VALPSQPGSNHSLLAAWNKKKTTTKSFLPIIGPIPEAGSKPAAAKPAASAKPSTSVRPQAEKKAAPDLYGTWSGNDFEPVMRLIRLDQATFDLKSVGDIIINLRRQVTDKPQDESLRLRLAAFLYAAGDYDGAAAEIRRAISLKPTDYAAYTLMARV